MKRLTVNLVSESEFTVQGHGVHTAYIEMRNGLEARPDINLIVNSKPLDNIAITHIHTVGSFSLRRLISRKGGKKVVSAHIVPESLVGSIIGARWWSHIFKYYLRWFYNRADMVLAVSPATKENLVKIGVHKPIEILENSIDTSQYQTTAEQKRKIREKLNLPQDKFIVVGNGQIQPRKRFDTFIKVAQQLPDIQFVWVGGIPFKAMGADFIELNHLMKHHPKNMLVTDVIPLAQSRLYTRAADAMFMPSVQETFGMSIIEGAASGLPIVARDIHDYAATFGDSIIRTDEKGFAKAIKELYDNSDYYAKWQKKSLALAKKYDTKAATTKLVKIYRNLIEL